MAFILFLFFFFLFSIRPPPGLLPVLGLLMLYMTLKKREREEEWKISRLSRERIKNHLYIHIKGTITQAGVDSPAQSHASYEARALPQATTAG